MRSRTYSKVIRSFLVMGLLWLSAYSFSQNIAVNNCSMSVADFNNVGTTRCIVLMCNYNNQHIEFSARKYGQTARGSSVSIPLNPGGTTVSIQNSPLPLFSLYVHDIVVIKSKIKAYNLAHPDAKIVEVIFSPALSATNELQLDIQISDTRLTLSNFAHFTAVPTGVKANPSPPYNVSQ